ncbi:hypothetical protein ACP70R_045581 [Stipagrostis hirtigluma subsp. patula]
MAAGEEGQRGVFFQYMERPYSYESSGVPRGAGTRTMASISAACSTASVIPTPTSRAVDIADTKEKGSIAAFLTNIMREQGYNVGCYSWFVLRCCARDVGLHYSSRHIFCRWYFVLRSGAMALEGLVQSWDEWGIQIVVLVSFALQVFLLDFEGVRPLSSSAVLRVVLWLDSNGLQL